MRIGIDLDDVLCDFVSRFSLMANQKCGRPPIGTEPSDWEWSNYGLTKEEIDAVWVDIRRTYNFWERLEIEPGVEPRLLARLDRQHELFFPTAREKTAGFSVAQQSAWWIKAHCSIEFPTVFVGSDKGLLAKAIGYDYFIDDRPKNCLAVKEALPDCKVFLKNSSHNLSYTPPFNIQRIPGINDLCNLVLGGGIT